MSPRRRGLFITVEGGDGSGKSTLVSYLAARLRGEGHAVCLAAEPGGTALGHHIKQFFVRCQSGEVPRPAPGAELLLFEAARAQNVEEVILPALDRGEVVLCDRFTDSTIAYQGYGRGLDLDEIERCNRTATRGLTPDLTLLLDLPPEQALPRVHADASPARSFDSLGGEPLDFHRRVRQGFLEVAGRDPGRVVVIDAARSPGEVDEEAWQSVRALMGDSNP